jgi:hypothetical protein
VTDAFVVLEEDEALDIFFERDWTDGLPVVLPTRARVAAMISPTGLDRDTVVGTVRKRAISVTVEDVAINAVMAGCRDDYFPIVLAAVETVCDESFNIHSASASTSGAAICLVVSGPSVVKVGMASRRNLLGGGNRANMTIGRAVRLIVRNVLGSRAGNMDASCIANPAKLSFCFAEDPPPAPWESLRVELGYDAEDTIVVALPTESSRQISNLHRSDAESLLRTFAAAIATPFTFPVAKHMHGILVIGPDHASHFIAQGWSKRQIREELCERTEVGLDELEAAGIQVEAGSQHEVPRTKSGKLATFSDPDDLLIVTAGESGLGFSAFIPPIAAKLHMKAASRRVDPALFGSTSPETTMRRAS